MADTTAPTATKTVWDFLTSEAFGKCLVLLVTLAVGAIGTLATQYVRAKPEPILAADLPQSARQVTIADLDNSLTVHGAALKTEIALAVRALLDERFPKRGGR